MSTASYNCTNAEQRSEGLAHAQRAIASKGVVVFPTDTVYGIGADAFSPQAVATLLAAKGRGRSMPPPVLIPRLQTMDGLATEISADAQKLADTFWPGALTLIFHAQPTLDWDLGDTQGTVALRMPNDQLALDLLTITGPLAVSSANRTGQPSAQSASEARAQLADAVEVYLEGGFRPLDGTDPMPSTIVDATGEHLRVVRQGAISLESLKSVVPGVLGIGEEPAPEPVADPVAESESEPVTEPAAEPDNEPVSELAEPVAEPQAAVESAPANELDPVADATPSAQPSQEPVPDQTT